MIASKGLILPTADSHKKEQTNGLEVLSDSYRFQDSIFFGSFSNMCSLPVQPRWQELAESKRQSVLDLIPTKWRLPQPFPSTENQKDVTGSYGHQYLEPKEIEITESDAVHIVAQMSSGKWTATEVVTAFCHRASIVHQLTNCLHEIFFEQAIADAKALDEQFAAGNGPIGPLHRLPISFKDQFHIPGVETTMGYVGWIDTFEGMKGTGKEKKAESELVREVRALGAITFCKNKSPAYCHEYGDVEQHRRIHL